MTLHVDFERLARESGRFAAVADQAGTVHRDLAARLAELGQCWGTDEIGRVFAAAHVTPAATTIDSLAALPSRLADVGTTFAATATAYADGERANVDRLRGQG